MNDNTSTQQVTLIDLVGGNLAVESTDHCVILRQQWDQQSGGACPWPSVTVWVRPRGGGTHLLFVNQEGCGPSAGRGMAWGESGCTC